MERRSKRMVKRGMQMQKGRLDVPRALGAGIERGMQRSQGVP